MSLSKTFVKVSRKNSEKKSEKKIQKDTQRIPSSDESDRSDEEVYDLSTDKDSTTKHKPLDPISDTHISKSVNIVHHDNVSSSTNKKVFTDDTQQRILIKNADHLRIMTYNVHGFKTKNFKKTLDLIIKTIGDIDPDILVLEEVYIYKPNEACTEQVLSRLLKPYKLRYGNFSKNGINAIFSKFMFNCSEIDLGRDPVMGIPRNALVCTFPDTVYLNDLIVIGTHLDVFDESGVLRRQQIQKILKGLQKTLQNPSLDDDQKLFDGKQIVITGDFNSLKRSDYTDEEWDQIVTIDRKRGVRTVVDAVPVLEEVGFEDSFDHCNEKIKVSVWSNRRVDYIFGKNVKFSQTTEHRTTLSDHYPIYADISLS